MPGALVIPSWLLCVYVCVYVYIAMFRLRCYVSIIRTSSFILMPCFDHKNLACLNCINSKIGIRIMIKYLSPPYLWWLCCISNCVRVTGLTGYMCCTGQRRWCYDVLQHINSISMSWVELRQQKNIYIRILISYQPAPIRPSRANKDQLKCRLLRRSAWWILKVWVRGQSCTHNPYKIQPIRSDEWPSGGSDISSSDRVQAAEFTLLRGKFWPSFGSLASFSCASWNAWSLEEGEKGDTHTVPFLFLSRVVISDACLPRIFILIQYCSDQVYECGKGLFFWDLLFIFRQSCSGIYYHAATAALDLKNSSPSFWLLLLLLLFFSLPFLGPFDHLIPPVFVK